MMLPNCLVPPVPRNRDSGSTNSQHPFREEKSDWKRGIPEQATQFTLDHLSRPQSRTFIDNETFLSRTEGLQFPWLERRPELRFTLVDRPRTFQITRRY